jgi:hypothetical protein
MREMQGIQWEWQSIDGSIVKAPLAIGESLLLHLFLLLSMHLADCLEQTEIV